MKHLWYFLHITIKIRYYKIEVNRIFIKLDKSKNKKYKFEIICDNTDYASKLKDYLLGLYYFVL